MVQGIFLFKDVMLNVKFCFCILKLTWYMHRLQQEKQDLEEQRLRKFCSVMEAVNCSLGGIYKQLTAGQGDAYLTYTEVTLLLFAEGVHFHVRCASA